MTNRRSYVLLTLSVLALILALAVGAVSSYADDGDTPQDDDAPVPFGCGAHAGYMWGGYAGENGQQGYGPGMMWNLEEGEIPEVCLELHEQGYGPGMMWNLEEGEIPEECLELHEQGFHGPGMMGRWNRTSGRGPGMMGGWRGSGQ